MDIQGKCGGEPVLRLSAADEVVLKIRGSKTDQLNRGEWRNHFRAGNAGDEQGGCPKLCVVEALAMYEAHAPERFTGNQKELALFAWASGALLTRSEVQQALECAAVAMGMQADEVGSHSLRIGGASALWAAYKDSALVRRWGRWSSDAFHGYLWETRDAAEGVSSRMAEVDLTPV